MKYTNKLKVTNSAVTICLSEEADQETEVWYKAINSLYYTIDEECREPKLLHYVAAIEKLLKSVEFLLCKFPYNTR